MLRLRALRFRSSSLIFTRDLYQIRTAPRYHPSFKSYPPTRQPQPREGSLRLMSTKDSIKPSGTALPKGWTDDGFYLQIDTFPSKSFSLPTGKSILYNDRRSVHLIDCNGSYYLWNEIGDGVDQILEPKDLPSIYEALEMWEAGDESKFKTQPLEP